MKKILILEDNPDAGELLTAVLERSDREVILCPDGVTAFLADKNFEHDISLIIFDIQLPKDDGITVVEYMKKINPYQKFLCISAYSDDHHIKLKELNVQYILKKPFYTNELVSMVDDILR